ncbi:MAG: membrane protein insertase YidC [Acidobacteria bacterium]|nr:MAG: membrane protein insertase YidC [Acidobacteriota bacterium]
MDNEKRVMIAFALSFVLLLIWRVMFVKTPPPAPKPSGAAQATAQQAMGQKGTEQTASKPEALKAPPAPQIPVVEGRQAEDITVENDLYRITFSTQGGVVKSWILKKYDDARGKPLDLVDPAACKQLGYPISIRTADDSLNQKVNQAFYAARPSGTTLKAPATLEFTYSDGHVQVQKMFTFGSDYMVRASVSVARDQNYVPVRVAWVGGFGDHSLPEQDEFAQSKVAYETNDKLESIDLRKVNSELTKAGPFGFAGLQDRYFAGIFFPESSDQVFGAGHTTWTPENWKEKDLPKAGYAELGSSVAQPLKFGLFVAPKSLDVLETTHPSLTGLVDFGWFSIIAKPLFLALRYIYEHWVLNYGWAIVILTIILNMALFPLKLKSIRSAQEMQRIAPLVKGIQDRYKQYKFNDPRKARMNQEVMKLYQEHGINPLGGCLPMLPQLPILYGFYESLETPFEFRHAPWIGWIKDLSMPDPSHIMGLPVPLLPTIMIVTMFIQQKMTPMAITDPNQKRMMMIMPLVFGLMFFHLASGLVLYFLAANIVGIVQQLIINRFITPKQPPLRPEKVVEAKA